MAYVYRHIRLDKNEPFYIGIGSDDKYNRAYQKINRSIYWKRIINKTKYKIEILFDNISWEEACKKEIEFIKLYGRVNLGKGILCNLTNGGEGAKGAIRSKLFGEKNSFYGKKHSPETRKILSEKRKGKPLSNETKLKMSLKLKGKFAGEKNPMFGKLVSQETRKKISQAVSGKVCYWKGKKLSEETKAKISKAGIGRKHTQESIKKMSDAQKGKKFTMEHKMNISKAKQNISDETRKKLSDAQKGKKRQPHSEEIKKKIGLGNKGKKLSDETRKKISESKKNKNSNLKKPKT